MATKVRVICRQCEQPEQRCDCEKYCVLCQGQVDVRMWQDGLYYCSACREACDYKVEGSGE